MWRDPGRTSGGEFRRHTAFPLGELGFHPLEHEADLVFVLTTVSARLSQVVDFFQNVLDADKPGQGAVSFDVTVALHDGAAFGCVLGVQQSRSPVPGGCEARDKIIRRKICSDLFKALLADFLVRYIVAVWVLV
jgi:hypothetical protein